MNIPRKKYETVFRFNPDFPIRIFCEKQRDCGPHTHEFMELVFITGGEADYYTGLSEHEPIRRGDVFVIPPDGVHGYHKCRDLRLINLLFEPKQLPLPLLELYNHPGYKQMFLPDYKHFEAGHGYPRLTLPEDKFQELEEILMHFVKTEYVDSAGRNCCRLGFFMVVLSRLCDLWRDYHTIAPPPVLDIGKVIQYLNKNFAKPLYLDDLTKLTAMSRNTLLRHFSRSMGYSPMEYVLHLRLTYAASMLSNTNSSIGEIATQAGFPDAGYFSRAFKKNYGISPAKYRSSISAKG